MGTSFYEETLRDGKTKKKTWAATYDFKESRKYWISEKEVLDGDLCRISCGRDYGPVVRQATF